MKVITFTLVLVLVLSVMAGAIETGQVIELKVNENIHGEYSWVRTSAMLELLEIGFFQ